MLPERWLDVAAMEESMGTVIRFPIERRLASKASVRREGETASIIIFPLNRTARRSEDRKPEPTKKTPALDAQSL